MLLYNGVVKGVLPTLIGASGLDRQKRDKIDETHKTSSCCTDVCDSTGNS